MPWPIPLPAEIADRASGVYEREYARVYALKNRNAAPALVDARSPQSTLAVDARVLAMSAFELWSYLPRLAQELMPDTATDWLERHGAIWGVTRIAATAATGNVAFTGIVGTTIPAALALSAPGGAAYATTASGTIGVGGTATVPVAAATPGAAGSLPAATVLTIVTPLSGLTSQSVVVDAGGLTGHDAEALGDWRNRILARIRRRGAAGNGDDFVAWTQEAAPGATVATMSPGTGLVTVAFAMPSGSTWRAPTAPELAAVTAYLNDGHLRKPLGAPIITVVGATLQPVNVSVHLNPDTTATRAAASDALALRMQEDAAIGGTIYVSRLDAALVNASGEFSHTRAAPAADVTAAATTLSVLGTVTFT